ncbi:MAG: Fic family protein [Nanoarchaeota archaeon]|nr:Fic family protein [Nanoarchaeota archaeon]MBU1005395.1 Fic family protein [Nanoarchaeota archaeon]
MFIEKRKIGKSIKYYLIYSYRETNEVKKIRRYLGLNLSVDQLGKARQEAEHQIKKELELLNTEIFHFSLSKKQIAKLNKYDGQIKVHHLQGFEWKRFTEEFAYNTNAIEGSTVQLGEVPEILSKNKAENSEEIETKGVAEAVSFIRSSKKDLSLDLLKKLHMLCFEGSKPFAGKFRNVEVVIRNGKGDIVHRGVPVSQLDNALKDLVGWYRKNKKRFKPLALAAILHNQFEEIHPFQDGNGRVGRLLLNFVLVKNKYTPINISLEDRGEYYQTLQEYHKNNNLKPTMEFLVKQYKKTLKQVTTR